ncbi:DUF2799 domain-containing protein [Marinicella gelatinilytica]|uniref:DUF2799 domain-containing protein n=1 Tax=Marinicella gelatinilytica TaxID=2996017 RepID=UPI002260870E|nr:DUF2799 domain-containing protein [Marinicella gelatinilytica]MCX7545006.1 DUF2799 domain-containing protein [Marinicella gelatinilytica]
MLRQVKVMVMVMLLAGIMSGCATLNENECLSADWYQIGFSDGVKGEPETYLEKHRKACSKHGVRTDLSEWLTGREAGLRRYCTAEKGYEEGLLNNKYHGVCAGREGREFQQAYQRGNELYQQRQLVAQIESDIKGIEQNMADLDHEWENLRADLLNDRLSSNERRQLVDRLDVVKRDNENMVGERQFLIEKLNQALVQLDYMEQEHRRKRY